MLSQFRSGQVSTGQRIRMAFALALAAATLLLAAGDAPPPPPPPPRSSTCSCTKQLSKSPCVEEVTFGCLHDETVWATAGCRGVFTCNGIAGVECSVDTNPPRNHTCKCRSAPSPTPPPAKPEPAQPVIPAGFFSSNIFWPFEQAEDGTVFACTYLPTLVMANHTRLIAHGSCATDPKYCDGFHFQLDSSSRSPKSFRRGQKEPVGFGLDVGEGDNPIYEGKVCQKHSDDGGRTWSPIRLVARGVMTGQCSLHDTLTPLPPTSGFELWVNSRRLADGVAPTHFLIASTLVYADVRALRRLVIMTGQIVWDDVRKVLLMHYATVTPTATNKSPGDGMVLEYRSDDLGDTWSSPRCIKASNHGAHNTTLPKVCADPLTSTMVAGGPRGDGGNTIWTSAGAALQLSPTNKYHPNRLLFTGHVNGCQQWWYEHEGY